MKKIKVGVLFGGMSAEHEVSKISAKGIIAAINKKKYSVTPVYVDRKGSVDINLLKKQDVVFPIIHGQNGEDGTAQGLLKFLGIPFVGAGVLGSAVAMDKDITKKLLIQAGISVATYIVLGSPNDQSVRGVQDLGLPVFVKPANQGSSFGITKVKNKLELLKAIKIAFKYDSKVLIEKFVPGREIECAVIGNENPIVSLPGEIIPKNEFHDYDSKYTDSIAILSAKLSPSQIVAVQKLAIRVYKTLQCSGMARVDFFLTSKGRFVVNELNTLPGFTSQSMFPKLWEASGLSFPDLLDKLIMLALAKKNRLV